MNCSEIHRRFVDYYTQYGFQYLPRAPMMHPSIPMSFVMSAGLVQVETSLANAEHRSGNKFVLVQDCFRHFDLDAIGTDNFHLSLFEMPAAFLFDQDGRRDIIAQMWQFVTKGLGIDPQRIWVSYFGGGKLAGYFLQCDELTYRAWRGVGVPEDRLVGLDRSHNYWLQGGGIQNGAQPLRKCGANTEMFYDLGKDYACGPTCQPGCRCGRFIEFSNLLFVTHQLNHHTNTLTQLADPFTEAVIGTERVAMILQNVQSVFDTTAYRPLMTAIHQCVTATDIAPQLIHASECVIADHLRALCVLVADDAPPPGKNGRERIMKLLIRGVMTRQLVLGIDMGFKNPFFLELLQLVIDFLDVEVQNTQSSAIISRLISYFETETQRFRRTVARGYRELEEMLSCNQGRTLSGLQIVDLEKRYGLPYLLIAKTLKSRGLDVPNVQYRKALNKWKGSLKNNSN